MERDNPSVSTRHLPLTGEAPGMTSKFDGADGFVCFGGENGGVTKTFGFFKHLTFETDLADFSQKTKFAETKRVFGEWFVFGGGNDGQSNAQIGSGVLDVHTAGDVYKNIFSGDGQIKMFGEHSADE